MSENIKFAVIGCGHIGKRHASMINDNSGAELVGLADTNAALESDLKERFNVPFFTSAESMYAAGIEADVVCVCTPNGLHDKQSILALENKCHVVCEKPMGLSKAGCEEVIFKALQVSRQVFCVMQNRYSPPSVWLKSVMKDQLLGEIYLVQVNCYWNRDDRYYAKSDWKGKLSLDGGPLFTQFSHFVDVMYWLFGDITDIKAKFDNFNHEHNTEFEDSGFVNFRFVNGGMGAFNYSTSVHNQNLESSMTIIGEKGTIKVGGQYMEKVEVCDIDGYDMPELAAANPPNDYGHYKGSAANHHFVIENVVETLQGKSTVSTNALEGLKVVDIIERIYAFRQL